MSEERTQGEEPSPDDEKATFEEIVHQLSEENSDLPDLKRLDEGLRKSSPYLPGRALSRHFNLPAGTATWGEVQNTPRQVAKLMDEMARGFNDVLDELSKSAERSEEHAKRSREDADSAKRWNRWMLGLAILALLVTLILGVLPLLGVSFTV